MRRSDSRRYGRTASLANDTSWNGDAMETLKDLASVTDEHGVAMTAYIDLDPSDSATPKERESHEHAVLDELRRYHPGDASHEAKLRFEATLARVSARLADLDLGAG